MRFISKYLPKSLFTRFILIIILPAILCQPLVIYLFYQRHWSNVVSHTSTLVANNLSTITILIDQKEPELAKQIAKHLNIEFSFSAQSNYNQLTSDIYRNEVDILYSAISKRFSNFKIIESGEILDIFIKTNRHIFKFTIPVKPLVNPTTYIFVLWILFLNLTVITTSILFGKSQIRSILELAKVADQFGKGIKKQDFKPSGASEVRIAGQAFIKMRQRIENQINRHTKMLAMISHDLKTPLTRLRLQIELLPTSESLDNMKNDLVSMQQMIDSYLNFAKGQLVAETTRINLAWLLKEYFENQPYKNLKVAWGVVQESIEFELETKNFTRVLDNITANSAKYARQIFVSLYRDNKMINIDIEDNGPGVDDKEKQMILKPFYRSDKARNLGKTSSVGLGLTIAREIIKEHKGFIKIIDSAKLGGLLVRIILPDNENSN